MSTLEVALGEAEAAPEELDVPVETVEVAKGETEVEAEAETTESEVETPEVVPPTTSETTIPITAFHGVRDELKNLKEQFETNQHQDRIDQPACFRPALVSTGKRQTNGRRSQNGCT